MLDGWCSFKHTDGALGEIQIPWLRSDLFKLVSSVLPRGELAKLNGRKDASSPMGTAGFASPRVGIMIPHAASQTSTPLVQASWRSPQRLTTSEPTPNLEEWKLKVNFKSGEEKCAPHPRLSMLHPYSSLPVAAGDSTPLTASIIPSSGLLPLDGSFMIVCVDRHAI